MLEGRNNFIKLAHIPTDDMAKKSAKHDKSSYSKLDQHFARKYTSKGSSEQSRSNNYETAITTSPRKNLTTMNSW